MDASLESLSRTTPRARLARERTLTWLRTCTREHRASTVHLGFPNEVDIPLSPGLAKIVSTGKRTLGVTPSSAKRPAKDPVEDTALFKKFSQTSNQKDSLKAQRRALLTTRPGTLKCSASSKRASKISCSSCTKGRGIWRCGREKGYRA